MVTPTQLIARAIRMGFKRSISPITGTVYLVRDDECFCIRRNGVVKELVLMPETRLALFDEYENAADVKREALILYFRDGVVWSTDTLTDVTVEDILK